MLLRLENLGTKEQIAEFEQWLTPKLERVKDTEKFSSEMRSVTNCIQVLAEPLKNFSDYNFCSIDNLCHAVISASNSFVSGNSYIEDEEAVTEFYTAFFNLLFLTSGATDNNLKNHFLIQLKINDINPFMPKRRILKSGVKFHFSQIPSPTKSDFMAKSLASCVVGSSAKYQDLVEVEPISDLTVILQIFLKEYVSLICEDEEETMQLWAICRSYITLNQLEPKKALGKYLLHSCTVFKVRGSVSASGGHITEEILREKLTSLGLESNSDFNTSDVKIGEEEVVEGNKRKKKTRAYDFILPYQINNWDPKPRLFIQSQFYAGDSGSVSHKVVDQTQSSRTFTLEKYPNARFVEYLDGAGYYSSLRGDLEHMLDFDNTASFFQVRSILIRLRRELQIIGFLTPIELAHSIITNEHNTKQNIFRSLLSDGYSIQEVQRTVAVCISNKSITECDDKYELTTTNLDVIRRLLILDIAANNASKISDTQRRSQKYILVPGYGTNYGILQSELTSLVCSSCKQFVITAPIFSSDVEWLLDEGVFKHR